MAMILPELGLAYFSCPKVACTSVKQMLHHALHGRFLGEPDPAAAEAGSPEADRDAQERAIHAAYSCQYFSPWHVTASAGLRRFAVLRHPVDRLVSCWRNRIMRHRDLERSWRGSDPDLPRQPDFDTFLHRLDEYRAASVPAMWHTEPQSAFLGADPAFYAALFRFEDLPLLRDRIAAWTGRAAVLPHLQTSDGVPVPAVTPAQRDLILRRYAVDLPLLRAAYPEFA